MSQTFEVKNFQGGLSDFADRGTRGAYLFSSGNDPRTQRDTLTCQQALVDEGLDTAGFSTSASPSVSASPTPSISVSPSASPSASSSPSSSVSSSASPSTGVSSSVSASPSASASPSGSLSVSSSNSASPSPSAGLTTVYEDLVLRFLNVSDGYCYQFGNTGNIYRRDSDGFVQRVYKAPQGRISGAWEWGIDTGIAYLYFATDKNLFRKPLPGKANWNDVEEVGELTSVGSDGWHTMRECGGSLIIANKTTLALVGYDGSFTDEAMKLYPGSIAKTIVERNGRTITGTYKPGYPYKGINAALDTEYPLAQVGDDGGIYFANMSDTMPIKRLPGGGKCNPGGVANQVDQSYFFEWDQDALNYIDKQAVGNMAMMAVYGADSGKNGVYLYGRKTKDSPFILNLDYPLEADELGAVIDVDGTMLVSYRDGTDFGVKATDPDNKATCIYEGLELPTKADRPADIVVWNTAEIEMATMPAETKVQFWYKLNRSGSFIQAKTANGSDQALGGNKAVFRLGCQAEVFQPRVVLIPSGNNTPEIYRLLVNFG